MNKEISAKFLPQNQRNKDDAKPKEIHEEIKKVNQKSKEKWLPEKWQQIEQCEKKYNYHNMHKKIKGFMSKNKYNEISKCLIETMQKYRKCAQASHEDWLLLGQNSFLSTTE